MMHSIIMPGIYKTTDAKRRNHLIQMCSLCARLHFYEDKDKLGAFVTVAHFTKES